MQVSLNDQIVVKNELGMVICRVCNEVMYTLPTDGVKKFPGLCEKIECYVESKKGKEIIG